MKGNTKVLALFNEILANELISINQYFLHARMYKNWGFGELNSKEYKQSIKAMKFADDLIERILFLEGLPNLQDLGKLLIGENVEEMLKADLALESDAVLPALNKGIAHCEDVQDYVSRQLLGKILHEKEEHVDWLETQQELIKSVGLENYQQTMM
ncbi:MAG TPA: bacterioferritin [Leucothrix sp.]|nr:bacterioferritin [Leucothrix sp.]HIQ14243.1 bacterioferritin [Leucothrix sp.]